MADEKPDQSVLPSKPIQVVPAAPGDQYVSPNTRKGTRKKNADEIEAERTASEGENKTS